MLLHLRIHVIPRLRAGGEYNPHMLRHACGDALANRGHDTRALQAYLSSTRFKNFWRE
jgi:site-specific recombinase XerD